LTQTTNTGRGGQAVPYSEQPARERTLSLGPTASKLTVASLSLAAILWLVGEAAVVPFLLAIAGVTYLVIALADRALSARTWRIAAAIVFASAMFGALLALNVLGIVGNLTGNPQSESLRNQWVISIGIGFYTLQIIGVGVDVMRRRIAMPPMLDYVFYILYLPKFLSGPIEQATFLERVRDYRLRLSDADLATGIPWLVLGLFMKFGVADSISRLVDIDYVRPLGVLIMTALFELRVYFDWAGYSLMAYGAAWCLGLPVMLNFAQPLFAHNPQELWHRWHISLGRWFREYLYLPLMRGIPYPILLSFLAPVAVFTISAMWHGVSFNFMLWGIFHAAAYLLFVKLLRHLPTPKFLGIVGFVFLLLIGRLLFMDDDTDRLLTKIGNLVSWQAWQADLSASAVQGLVDHIKSMQLTKAGMLGVLVAGTVIFIEWRNERRHPDKPYRLLIHPVATVALAFLTLLIASATDIGFVYARN
jgi:alginate O-acetyltransferase complex protein AlgI